MSKHLIVGIWMVCLALLIVNPVKVLLGQVQQEPEGTKEMSRDTRVIDVAIVVAHSKSMHVRQRPVGGGPSTEVELMLKRGTFSDFFSGKTYPFSFSQFSDVGFALHDGETYVLAYYRDWQGVSMNETQVVMLRRFDFLRGDSSDINSLKGARLSALITMWGNPDTIDVTNTPPDAAGEVHSVVVATFNERGYKAFLTPKATVQRIETYFPHFSL